MPMIVEHLKNFIRHGKQANQKLIAQGDIAYESNASDNNRVHPEIKTKVDNATAVAQIVAEEREQKNKIPTYPGLERYHLLEKMGEGAFSNVYKAVDTETKERVAIKVVRKRELNYSQEKHFHRDMKKKPRVIERSNILKEVQIMRQLKHPSIVSLISFSESPEYYYLVLELMEGGELFNQIVRLTYFSEPLSRHVIVQVAEGIRYLHEESGVVHRDIKPENLLFESIPIYPSKEPQPPPGPNDEPKEDEGEFIPGVGGGGIGKIKIADFGLSKVVWDEKTMTPCGTVGYTAPEIVKDERYSKSVDMWALGCVLYTLLCGFPPFYDESIQELTMKVEKGEYTFLSPWWDDVSPSAKDLITHLLTVDPDKRYTIKQFFEHPWVNDKPFPVPVPADTIVNRSIDPSKLKTRVESPIIFDDRLGTPGENVRRKDMLSPSISLKEVFDVGYAVHRMEEEGARRRKIKMGGGKLGALNPFKNKFVHQMNDDDLSDEDNEASPSNMHEVATTSNDPVKVKAGAKHNKDNSRRVAFELNLDSATLLSRRKVSVGA